MATYLPQCASDPGPDGVCPAGQLVWVDSQVFSALPELTPGEISQLAAAFLTMFVVAVGIRLLLKQLTK